MPNGDPGTLTAIPQFPTGSDQVGTLTGIAQPGMQTPPNPHDILSNQPETWSDWSKNLGLAALSGGMYAATAPMDMPGAVWNLTADAVNRIAPNTMQTVSTPGQRYQQALGVPQPVTPLESAVQGGVALPMTALWGGPASEVAAGQRFANALRGLPTNAAIGATGGLLGYAGVDPIVQALLMGGASRLAANKVPGMQSGASTTDADLAADLRRENVPVNPVDEGTSGSAKTYQATSALPLTGAEGFAQGQYKSWADAVARRIGVTTDTDGMFTPQTIQDASTRINNLYAQARGAPAMPFNAGTNSNLLWQKLTAIAQDAAGKGTPQAQPFQGAVNYINGLKNYANNQGGSLTAADLIGELRTDSGLSGMAASDPAAAGYYARIRNAIDDEFGDHLVRNAPNSYEAYEAAKDSYRSLQTISAGLQASNGQLTPAALAAAAKASPFEGSGPGSLFNLGQAGSRYVAVPPTQGPVGQAILSRQQGVVGSLRQLGLAGLGLKELSDIAEQIPGGKGAMAIAALPTVPLAIAQNRAARAMPVSGGPPPSRGQAWANAILQATPPAGRTAQPDPTKPGLPPSLQFQPF